MARPSLLESRPGRAVSGCPPKRRALLKVMYFLLGKLEERKPAPLLALRRFRTPDSTIGVLLIARYPVLLIARGQSQVFPQLSRVGGGTGRKVSSSVVVRHPLDAEDVAGQRLPRHQGAQVVGEVREAGRAARLAVESAGSRIASRVPAARRACVPSGTASVRCRPSSGNKPGRWSAPGRRRARRHRTSPAGSVRCPAACHWHRPVRATR